MGFYAVKGDPLQVERAYEQSPVISLMTDAAAEDNVPASVRAVSDRILNSDLSVMQNDAVPSGSDAAILWMAGDQLIEGSSAALRAKAWGSGGRVFFPVHLPCLAEIDLVGLQPRVWIEGKNSDTTANDIRVAGAASPSSLAMGLLEENNGLWARLHCALLAEQKAAGGGLEPLSKLWRDSRVLPPVYGGLLMRNLVVLQIRQNKLEQAEHLLNLAMDTYPRYAELSLLAAWLCITQEILCKAGRHVQQAMEHSDPSFVGSGGEATYRAQWLFGLAAELCGKQLLAVNCYKVGAAARPAFPPSVLGLLRQRLSRVDAGSFASWVLLSLAHREPQYLEMIFQFFLIHRQFEPAQRLLLSSQISDDTRQKLQKLLDESSAVYRPSPRAAGVKPGVMLIGSFYVNSSLARINRELAAGITGAGDFETAIEPHGCGDVLASSVPCFEAIATGYKKRLSRLDLTIRLHWPPDFGAAPAGKLVCIFPWEYHAVPRQWVEQIGRNVTEVWATSQFVKDALSAGGVQPDRIQVIPCGIDTKVFTPEGPAWRPEGCRSFVFLFVGGAILRKGIDVLWKAYAKAFSSGDDVTLVVKDIGPGTFYLGMSLLEPMKTSARHPRAPHLVTLNDDLDDAKLAALYRGSNAFVLPYRGEGFGMPLAEALACGKPVLTTGLGPAREFCPPEASYFIPARLQEYSNPQNQFGPMTSPEAWFEPDAEALADAMRRVFEHPEDAARQG
ncbi:MAG: glycosyltransferase, partial [Terriglobia bacterium]